MVVGAKGEGEGVVCAAPSCSLPACRCFPAARPMPAARLFAALHYCPLPSTRARCPIARRSYATDRARRSFPHVTLRADFAPWRVPRHEPGRDPRRAATRGLGGQYHYVERWPGPSSWRCTVAARCLYAAPPPARCLPAAAFALPVRCPACSLPTALHAPLLAVPSTRARCHALTARVARSRRSILYVDVLDVFEGDYFFLNLACCMPHARRHARRRHARSLWNGLTLETGLLWNRFALGTGLP